MTLFQFLLLLRAVVPPFLFAKIHPFYAMIINEAGLDGIISPHHLFTHTIPDNIKGKHKFAYDIPLDVWGFANSLQPVFIKTNPHYEVFSEYRGLMTFLFVYRMIGILLVYKLKSYRILALFPNLFIAAYLAISYCRLFGDKDVKGMIKIFFIVFYFRELGIIGVNGKID